jgi:hypothetical protein
MMSVGFSIMATRSVPLWPWSAIGIGSYNVSDSLLRVASVHSNNITADPRTKSNLRPSPAANSGSTASIFL